MADHDQNEAPSLAQVWQLPVLALSLITFGFGLWLASAPVPESGDGEDRALRRLAQEVDAGRYEQALETSERLAERFEQVPEPLHGRFYALTGDAASLRHRGADHVEPDAHRRVVDAYSRAQEHGAELDSGQAERFAESLAALGDLNRALAVLDELGPEGAEQRQRILRGPIEQGLAKPTDELDEPTVADAIERLLDDPQLTIENEIWATARQGELLMRTGRVPAAIDMLLRRLARLQDEQDAPLGELKLQLARAYLEEAELGNAERWLLRAQEQIEPDDPLYGDAMVALGQLQFARGNPAEAVEHFTAAVRQYAHTDAYPGALLGKAESEARLGRHQRALADYAEAVALAQETPGEAGDLRRRLVESLESQFDLRFGQSDYELALDYLNLQRQLQVDPPAELLLSLAVTHHRLAQQLAGGRAQALPDDPRVDRRPTLEARLDVDVDLDPPPFAADRPEAGAEADEIDADADPVTAAQVVEHRRAAADAYLAHAEAVVAEDDDAYGHSLWMAGTLYDEAGVHRGAARVFERYIEQRPDDPRRLRAIFRLAQAHRADGRPEEAVPLYTQLVDDHPNTPEAYSSLVPLARSYLAKGPDYTDRAEQVLLSVVTDHEALRPESAEFRDALIELGQLYYRRGEEGDYERAIARLSEVVERYGREEPMPDLHFQLGDAYRKSVQQLDRRLETAMPPSQRSELAEERATRLHEARESFDRVIRIYERGDTRSLDELEALYLRNSYFYRADCAYELGQYEGPEGAITLYEKAVERYDEDPAALVGLVQIVNSHAELGEWDKARTANERAKVYLDAIPEQAFEDPDLPMSREHWQRWLDWTSQLALDDRAAQAEP